MAQIPQTSADLEELRDIADDVEESEFVPYACLYNAHTILTKNGELLQTIRINGLSYENIQQESMDLRASIRSVIQKHIPNNSFAIWLHTIRRQHDLSTSGEHASPFAKQLNEAWNNEHSFTKQYTNEVFISIVHEGQDASILSPKVFLRGLLPRIDLRWRNSFIDAIYEKLNLIAEEIEEALQPFGAERLGIYEEDGVCYSEFLRFLNRLINFVDEPVPVLDRDLSEQLTSGDITFSYNTMEVRNPDGRRRFGSILSIKDYKEKALPFIDRFLKLPMEFVVTQCISFISPEKALTEYRDIKRITDLSEEADLPRLMELEAILASGVGNIADFGEQQLTLFLTADSVRQVERNIRHAVNFLSRHGIVSFREDLKFEECYWAQMPGNFEFVSRLQSTASGHMAGFANLYNHPVGLLEHNHWGPAVTTLQTANGTPYFFNFHVEETGHTLVVGRPGNGKSTLVNFLLTQATKFQPQLYYFDVTNQNQTFIEKIGGASYVFGPAGTPASIAAPPLNPFTLPATEGNVRFLQRWLGVLIRCTGKSLDEDDKQAIFESLKKLYESKEARSLSRFAALLPDATAAKFQPWLKGGLQGHVFDHEQDLFNQPGDIRGFHIADILYDAAIVSPLTSYLLQRLTLQLDGRPAIIAVDEAWQILGQTHIVADLETWLNRLTEMNAIIIAQTSQIEEVGEIAFSGALLDRCVTQIFLPDEMADDIYVENFALSDIELSYLELLSTEQRHFLIKRMENTIIAELNLAPLEKELAILSGEQPKSHSKAA